MPSLPAYVEALYSGFGINRQSALLRTEMESGPPKQAKIKSRVMIEMPIVFLVESLADYNSFVAWFQAAAPTGINYGAEWFTWDSPITGASQEVRIKEGMIDARPVGGTLVRWHIGCTLEYWSA